MVSYGIVPYYIIISYKLSQFLPKNVNYRKNRITNVKRYIFVGSYAPDEVSLASMLNFKCILPISCVGWYFSFFGCWRPNCPSSRSRQKLMMGSVAAHHDPSSQHLPSTPSLSPPPQHSNAHASPSHLIFETSIFYLLQKMYALLRDKEVLYCFLCWWYVGLQQNPTYMPNIVK